MTIRGVGIQGTYLKLADGANCDMFKFTNPGTTHLFPQIENMYLMGNKNNNASGSGIVTDTELWDGRIYNIFIAYFAEMGVDLKYGWGWLIDNAIIEENGSYGLKIAGSKGYKVCNCKIRKNGSHGLYIATGGTGGLISCCEFNTEGESGHNAIRIDAGNCMFTNILIDDAGSGSDGILVQSTNNHFVNVWINGQSKMRYGININGSTRTDNNFTNIYIQNTTNTGFRDLGVRTRRYGCGFAPATDSGAMSGNETFSGMGPTIILRDPADSDRTLNPTGSEFSDGHIIIVKNTGNGGETLTFDSEGIADALVNGNKGMYFYDGAAWNKLN